MAIQNCTNCQVGMIGLDHVSAEFTQDSVTDEPVLDLILSCPACGQKYNAFLSFNTLMPLEEC